MRKRKKRMKNSEDNKREKTDFAAQIKRITNDLYYISETDAEVAPFAGKEAEDVNAETILNQIEKPLDSPVEEKEFAAFFARLTETQDWFGDEEKATTRKFIDLKNLLEQNLKDLKVFKIGKVQLDIYVVGLDAENKLTGIQTKAVET